MKSFSLIKNIRPKKFAYQPRFYDEEKENLESRLAAADPDGRKDMEAMKLRISDGLQRQSQDNRLWKKKLTRQYNRRIFVILMLLMVFTFILVMIYFPVLAQLLQ